MGLPLAQYNPNVTSALPNWRGSPARTWHIAFKCRPFIHHNTVDDQSLNIIYTIILHRIRHRRFEKLLYWQRCLFTRKPQNTEGLTYTLPAHCIYDHPYLTWRDANVCCTCFHSHVPLRDLPACFFSISALSYALSYHYGHGRSWLAKILPVYALPCFQ